MIGWSSLVQAPSTRLILSQLSLVEIQSVFATKVRTGVIDKATLDQLRGLFFADRAVRVKNFETLGEII